VGCVGAANHEIVSATCAWCYAVGHVAESRNARCLQLQIKLFYFYFSSV
jgi:hypothetical protein